MQTIRTTLNLDRELIEEAAERRRGMTRTAIIEEGLRALIARDAAERLAALGGSAPPRPRTEAPSASRLALILADTNAWITHLRSSDPRLVRLLGDNRIVTCDVVIGELLLGSGLPKALTSTLALLPRLPGPTTAETLAYLRSHHAVFRSSGVGWADTQIIITAAEAGALVYSSDIAVRKVWRKLGFRSS